MPVQRDRMVMIALFFVRSSDSDVGGKELVTCLILVWYSSSECGYL
jgi:hypothetical protein